MKCRRIILPLIFVMLTFACVSPFASASKPADKSAPLQVELTQKHDSTPIWLQVVDKVAWPFIAVVAVIIFRTPIRALLKAATTPGADLTIGAFGLKIPVLESKIEIQSMQLAQQKGQLEHQSEQIRNLVRFSMAWYIYKMLFDIHKAQTSGGEYIYRDDHSMDRNLHFLIDHGYVQEVFPLPSEGEEISRRVSLTPSGHDLIAMRGPA